MTTSIIIVIILTVVVIGILTYMSLRTETGYFSVVPISKPKSPKEQLVDYFAMNWSRIAKILIRKNCEDDNIPQEFIDEFIENFPASYNSLMSTFESKKRRVCFDNPPNYLNINLPYSFIDFYKKKSVRYFICFKAV